MAPDLLQLPLGGNLRPRGAGRKTAGLALALNRDCNRRWNPRLKNLRQNLMKRAVLTILLCTLMAVTLFAETAIVSQDWVRLRNAPDGKAKAIGLVYGNDAYPVLKTEGGWVQLRTSKGQVGWVPADKLIIDGKALTSSKGPTKDLAKATSLQRRGYRANAQAELKDIADDNPGTFEQYEAIRHLLYYYPVSTLPEPRNGQIHPAGALAAAKLADIIIKCANQTPRPPPERFWQLEYVKAGFTPRWGAFPTEFPRSSCP